MSVNKKIPPRIHVWASVSHSTWELSDALRQLRVSHTIDSDDKTKAARRINMKRDQPMSVHLTTSLKGLRPGAVNFMVASHGTLSHTNIPHLPVKWSDEEDLASVVKQCLLSDVSIHLSVNKMTTVDFVNYVAKPSLLNKIQTEILKISPYSLRKEVNALMLDYFNSRCSERTLLQFLNRSLKFDRLQSIVKQGKDLRVAVAMLAHTDAETVALQTGISSFDILYLTKAKK